MTLEMTLPPYAAYGILFTSISMLWVYPAAAQDWRTGQVSNWLTIPPIFIGALLWGFGWSDAPWWLVLLFVILSLGLWHFGYLGGADAKGWIAFSLLGLPVLAPAIAGLGVWYLLLRAEIVKPPREKFPGYPGYAIGLLAAWVGYQVPAFLSLA